jgi:carboxyl-terminal processing protease
MNRYEHGELFDADSIHFPDSLKYTTLVNKRTVFGGGGIMPDCFVPMDTTGTMLHGRLNANGVINKVAISEVDKKRKELLQTYPDAHSFAQGYQVSDELAGRIHEQAVTDSVEWDEAQYEQSRSLILLQLKALIARDLYDSSAFFRIVNQENEIFREGLRIISDEQRYQGFLKGASSNYVQQ